MDSLFLFLKDEYGLEKALSGLLEDTPLHGQRVKVEKDLPDSEYSKIPVNRGNDRPRGGDNNGYGGFAPRYDSGNNGGGGARDAYYGGGNDRSRGARDGGYNSGAPPPVHRGDPPAGRYDSRDPYPRYDQPAPRYDAPSPRYDNRGPPPLPGAGDRGGYDNRRPYR